MPVSQHLADTVYSVVCRNNEDAKELLTLLNAASSAIVVIAMGALPANYYRVDTTATAADAVARVYPTADEAVAAFEAQSVYTSGVIWMTEGQVHADWTGAGLSGEKSVTFTTGTPNAATLGVDAGILVAPVGTQNLRFSRLRVNFVAQLDATGWDVDFADCSLTGASATAVTGVVAARCTAVNTTAFNVGLLGIVGGAGLAIRLERCDFLFFATASSVCFLAMGTSLVSVIDSVVRATIDGDANTLDLFATAGAETPVLVMRGGAVRLASTGGAAANEFVKAGYSSVDVAGTTFSREAGGTVNYGKAGTTAQLSWFGADPDDGNLPTGSWHNNAGTIEQV